MVFNRTWHHPNPRATYWPYILYFDTGKGGGRVEPERRLEGQQFTKLGRKYQHDWLYLQSINSDKPVPQSPFTGQLFSMTTFCIAFYEEREVAIMRCVTNPNIIEKLCFTSFRDSIAFPSTFSTPWKKQARWHVQYKLLVLAWIDILKFQKSKVIWSRGKCTEMPLSDPK